MFSPSSLALWSNSAIHVPAAACVSFLNELATPRHAALPLKPCQVMQMDQRPWSVRGCVAT